MKESIVISGESGTILFRIIPFYLVALGTTDWLESIAASTNLVVAVGDNGAVYSSANGVSWTRKTTPYRAWLRSVAWGPPGFVAAGEETVLMNSASGETWRQRSSGTTRHLNRVVWANGHYWVAGDDGKVLTSENGTVWTASVCGATNFLYAAAGTTETQLVAGENEVRLRGGIGQDDAFDQSVSAARVELLQRVVGRGFLLAGRRHRLWVQGYKTNATSDTLWYEPAVSVHDWLWAVTRTPHFYLAVGDRGTVMASDNGE